MKVIKMKYNIIVNIKKVENKVLIKNPCHKAYITFKGMKETTIMVKIPILHLRMIHPQWATLSSLKKTTFTEST